MSTTVDNRVVSMRFDNEEFEQKATKSISTLDKLKNALKFSGASKDLDNVNKSFKEVDANPLLNAINGINSGFTTMIAKATIVNRATNALIDSTKRFVESMSVNQVNAGWDKYAEKTSAVQTIMAATAKDFNDTGKQMAYVNGQLEKLNWFTDETSYNFTDMVSNIGKFTSNGIKLDKSVTAMQGIATWAAVSGANANEASRAMYNLSQALATGSVKLIDWKSIENANMATVEFKENAIESAVALGTLKKTGDGLYKTLKGNAVSVTNFNEALSDAWLTSDVLMKTLDKYGSFTDKLYEVSEVTGKTATQLLSDIEKYQNGTLELADYAEECEMSIEEVTAMMDELSDETYALGKKSFKAAQEAKTFSEAISATTDAISTGWMKTFELIFGNYEEAKRLWTSVANIMYDVFAASGEIRNELLGEWKSGGGRKTFLEGINNLMEAILRIVKPFKDAFRDIFPEKTSEDLLNITSKFERFTKSLQINSKQMSNLRKIARGVFSVIKLVLNTISSLAHSIGNVLSPALEFTGGTFLDLLGYLGDFIYYCTEVVDKTGFISNAFNKVGEFGGKLIKILSTLITQFRQSTVGQATFTVLTTVLRKAVDLAGKLVTYIGNVVSGLADLNSFSFTNILEVLNGAFSNTFGLNDNLEVEVKDSEGTLSSFQTAIQNACSNVTTTFTNLGNKLSSIFETIRYWLADVPWGELITIGLGAAMIFGIYKIVKQLTNLTNAVSNLTKGFKGIAGGLQDVLKSISNMFNAVTANIKAPTYLKIAKAIALVAASIFALAQCDSQQLQQAIESMIVCITLFGVLGALLPRVQGPMQKSISTISNVAVTVVALAASVWLVVKAFKELETLDLENLAGRIIYVGVVIAALAVAAYLMNGNITRLSDASGKIKSTNTAAKNVLAMSASVYIIAKAFKSIAEIKFEDPKSAIIAIAGATAAVGALILSLGKIKGTDGVKGAFAITSCVLAIVVMAKMVEKLAKIKVETLINAVGRMAILIAVLGTLFATTQYVSQNAAKVGAMLGAMLGGLAAAILALTVSVGLLGKMKLTTVVQGGIVVAALMTFCGIFLALTKTMSKDIHKASVTLLALAAAIGVIGVIATLLGTIPGETLIRGVAAVGAIGLIFAALVLASGHAKNLGKDIALLTTMLVAVSAMIAALTLIKDAEGVRAAGLAISEVMIAMAAILAATSIAKMSKQIAVAMALAIVAVAAIGGLMIAITNNFEHPEKAITAADGLVVICGAVIAVATAMAGISKIVTVIPLAGIGKAAVVIAAAIAAVALILGIIESVSISDDLAKKCQTVGEAIGSLVGGLVGGVAGGALTALGNGLAAFNSSMEGVDPEKLKAGLSCVIDAAKAIAVLVGVGFLESLSVLASAVTIATFPRQMMFLGNALRNFSEALGDTNIERIEAAIPAIRALVEISGMLTGIGGVVQFFTGKKSFAVFGAQLALFGWSLQAFSKSLEGVKMSLIEDSIPAVRSLVEIGNELPRSPGLFSIFFGSKNFTTFGQQLSDFGRAMKDYYFQIANIDFTTLWRSISGARAMVEIANSLPEKGLWQLISGQQDLVEFGDQLAEFGEAMSKYYTSIAMVSNFGDSDAILTGARAVVAFLPELDGVKTESILAFGDAIAEFGKEFRQFFYDMTQLDGDDPLGPVVANTYEALVKLQSYTDKFKTAGEDCIKGLLEGLENETLLSKLETSGVSMAAKFLKGFRHESEWGSPWGTMIEAGMDAALGLQQGIKKSSASSAGGLLGGTFLDGFREETGWHSPWDTMIQSINDCVSGIWNGLKKNKQEIEDAGGLMGKEFGDAEVITAEGTVVNGLGQLVGVVTNSDEYAELKSVLSGDGLLGDSALDTDDYEQAYAEAIEETTNSVTADTEYSFSNLGTTAADAFLTALEDRISDYDLDMSTIDLEQELWEATIGKNATDAEKTARETDNLTAKIALQNEKVAAANEKYEYTIKKFGKTSQDAKKAYQELLQQQIDLADLMEQVNEINNTASNNNADAMVAYAKWVSESQEDLLKLGFTMEEISQAAQDATGYRLNQTTETMTNSVSDAVTTAMGTVATTYANTAESTLGALTSNFSDYGSLYANSLGTGMANGSGAVASGAKVDANSALNTINGTYSQWYTTGQNVAEGFKQGILSKAAEIGEAARQIAVTALNAAQVAVDSHSPSRKFMWLGEMCGEGLAIGFESMTKRVTDASEGVSLGAIDAARSTISQIAQVIDTDGALHPEITPVLDLSEVRSGIRGVASSLSGTAVINTRAATLQVGSAASSMSRKVSDVDQGSSSSSQNGSQSFNFVQNNYSPKSLSRAEIYRNTNNQFSAFKEAVSKA